MSVEASVYTAHLPLKGVDVITFGTKHDLELRLVIPFKCCMVDDELLERPLRKADLMIYCWPATDRETTRRLDRAISKADKAGILSVEERIAWFDFRCERYDYEKFWKRHPEEREDFEESISTEALKTLRSAKTRYFFRCGLRPPRNADYLNSVAMLIRDATEGYLWE